MMVMLLACVKYRMETSLRNYPVQAKLVEGIGEKAVSLKPVKRPLLVAVTHKMDAYLLLKNSSS